jgi:hypothetical protein
VKFSQYEPRITNCNSPNVVPIHIIQVFWRWRNMVLAINTITSISLVAVGMASIELVVAILPLRGAVVVMMHVGVLEVGTINPPRWISVSREDSHSRCARRGWLVRWLVRRLPRPSFRRRRGVGWRRPSFRRRRGVGWRRCTPFLGVSIVAILTDCTRHVDGKWVNRTGGVVVDEAL